MSTKRIPRLVAVDSTASLLFFKGYEYISKTCDSLGTDIFETRLLFRPTICFRGESAAKAFYDNELFIRRGAAPTRIQRGLLGRGGVHSLDGEDHRDRKRMFMSLMMPGSIERLSRISSDQWARKTGDWQEQKEIVLFEEAQEVLFRSICQWAGVSLEEEDVRQRTRELVAMIDSFGGVGPRYWRGVRARKSAERWMREKIRAARMHAAAPSHSALGVIAFHRDANGRLLDEQIAAVELLNVLRPTLAVSYFVVFAAVALLENPVYRMKIQDGTDDDLSCFVQEVRRFYPFAPAMGAIARKSFSWNGYPIPAGRLVVLDLYGTNHDPRIWQDPAEFRPERFYNKEITPFNFVPNGGGDFFSQHRCAGEWITIELLKCAVRYLCDGIDYDVPPQNLEISLTRMPTFPKSGFVLQDVRPPVGERRRAA